MLGNEDKSSPSIRERLNGEPTLPYILTKPENVRVVYKTCNKHLVLEILLSVIYGHRKLFLENNEKL
jgi:hypothetical protein